MKITTNKKTEVTAADTGLTGLRRKIKDALTEDICQEVVSIAYSEDDTFTQDAFIEADVFWDIHSNDDVFEITKQFFNGEDLDAKGPANPNRNYFRFDGYDNIESTDYPGDIYLEQLDIEIIDYILDHLDDRTFPEELQDILDEYNNVNKKEG